MKGHIRTGEKCPVCRGKFELATVGLDVDLVCPRCQTRPRRYYVDINDQGERTRIYSTKQGEVFTAFGAARTTLDTIRLEIQEGYFDRTLYVKRDQKPLLVENYCEFWYESQKEDDKKPATLRQTRMAIDRIVAHFKGRDIRRIRKRHCREYLNKLPASIRYNHRAKLQALLNFAYDNEDLENPIRVVKVKAQDRKSPIWLTPEQQEQILSCVPDIDQSIIRFQIQYGCRTGEVCALQWDCVDFRKGAVTIRRNFSSNVLVESPKDNEWRPLPMVPDIRNMLKGLRKERQDLVPWVFGKSGNKYYHYLPQSLQYVWATAGKKAGYPGVHLHHNRHSFVLQRLEAGHTYEEIAPITGHDDIKIMQKFYGKLQPQKLARVVEMKSVRSLSVGGEGHPKKHNKTSNF